MARLLKDSPAIFQSSDILPFTLKPNTSARFRTAEFDTSISINKNGYRGIPVDLRKKKRVRVLVLGDSFTFGHGVNDGETYSARLSALFGKNVEVINAGYASGYYPDTYYLFLKTFGSQLTPDFILVGFFIGNDIDHPLSDEHEWVQKDGHGLPLQIKNIDSVVENGYWIARNMQFRYKWLFLRNSHLFQLIVDRSIPLLPFSPSPDLAETVKQRINAFANIYRTNYPDRTKALVGRVEALFLAMDDLAQENKSSFVPIMIPELAQIDRRSILKGTSHPEQLDFEKPQRLFSKFFEDHNIPYIDLLPAMRAHKGERLYFPQDRHWTTAGHQLASEIIWSYLRDKIYRLKVQ